jgi:hypothetical protein
MGKQQDQPSPAAASKNTLLVAVAHHHLPTAQKEAKIASVIQLIPKTTCVTFLSRSF